MLKKYNILIVAMICLCSVINVACLKSFSEERYMTDKTSETSFKATNTFDFRDDLETCETLFELINENAYKKELNYVPINNRDELIEVAQLALKDCLGDKYLDIGTRAEPLTEFKEIAGARIAYYCGGETYVAFEQTTGKLLCCFDLRVSESLTSIEFYGDIIADGSRQNDWQLRYEFDICRMTEQDIRKIAKIFCIFQLPSLNKEIKDAEMAFGCAVDYLVGPLENAGPEFEVYYNATAEAWIVANDWNIQIILRDTGEYLCVLSSR